MQVPTRRADKIPRQKKDARVSEAKFLELQKDLERMKKIRPKLAEEVKRLASDGDFSENAAYQIAKGRLRGLNRKVDETEDLLKRAEIIKPDKNKNVVGLGSLVTVEIGGKKKIYEILGSNESNPSLGIISSHSPLGQALVGKRINDKVKIKLTQKTAEYKIIDIK
jgi:transcription elongation factor GreA